MNAARSLDGWRSLFWTAFNLSANPMVMLQPDRVFVGANDAFLKTLGYSRARVLGRKLDQFVPVGSRQRLKQEWRELLRTGRLNGEREMVRADGWHVRVQFAGHREIITGRDLRTGRLDGEQEMVRADGRHVQVQFAAHREIVTGRDLVLGVVLDLDTRPMRCGATAVDASAASLTPREREVVALVALGRRRREIAAALFISESTVKTHLRNAMHKLEVHSQAQLVAVALARGLIESEQPGIAEGSGSAWRPHR